MSRCISPLLIRTSGRRDVVPCGKCNFCLATKRADWTFRLEQELKVAQSSYFITLTYEDQFLPFNPLSGLPELSKRDYQLFTKSLRKINSQVVDWPLRYYAVGEYGTNTARPHYHAIMFNLSPLISQKLDQVWQKGNCLAGTVEPASIRYVTKYVINRDGEYTGREPPFSMMSKRPGLGANYLDTHKSWHRQGLKNYTQVNGVIGRLPRYYKEKMFSKLEKLRLQNEGIVEGDKAYSESVDRLSKFHLDPYHYYDESLQNKHDSIVSKINSQNVF